MKAKKVFLILVAILVGMTSFSVFASGFRLPESSITGMALSNAVVADSDQPGALIYNPAIMSAREERRLVNAGFINVSLDAEVTPDNGNPAESDGESNVQLPSFYYMSKVSKQWSWGLGLHAPFGLETKWPDETFASFNTTPIDTDGSEPEASKLEVVNLSPNVAYRIDDNNSVALGLNYYIIKELIFNTQAIEISADGEDLGYTLAYHYMRGPWNFGAIYRSAVNTNVEGDISVAGFTADVEADIELPKMLQIGIHNQINEQWAIEFDIERTYWSSFDSVEIKHKLPPALGIPNPIENTNNWKNVNAYRLGITYQLSNLTQLFFGYTRDETPQPDNYFSARIPDADRQLFSAGFSRKVGKDWTIEGGIMLVKFEDRTVQNTTPFPAADANGTTAYNGKYKSEALLIGLGFSKTFAR